MATLGKNDAGDVAAFFPQTASVVSVCSFPLQIDNATFTKMSVYKSSGNSVISAKGLIYTGDGVVPTSLIAQTNPTSVVSYGTFTDLQFQSPFILNSGNYYLGIMADQSMTTLSTVQQPSILHVISNVANTFPTPTTSFSGVIYSTSEKPIYATFTTPSVFNGAVS